ncbi:N-acetylneuraminate synthase [Allopseudospirillum japonicum]|uniref:N-acetylneuraminate synthase n=1 Tax=Allopseudospirillum japonicum TaxID=64971 RepID=A0A1H6UAN4_9GAMM|nr:pseudaminic acid synthase [Allopseudospirillum japonicum]SEI86677.1 N-acetylneuraminate synthase [Allopseudospirillum japonicum]
MKINGRLISKHAPPYIIAEMSGNHNGDINRAFELIEQAKKAGADAIKLQTYRADTITINHNAPEFKVEGGLWHGRYLYELYEEAHTPWEWHARLFEKAKSVDITIFSAPFDYSAVDMLEELNTPAYKIASPEIVDIPLIEYVASKGKPVIISTGMASFEEIDLAVKSAQKAGAKDIALLHCTSAYPTPPEEANLSSIPDLIKQTGVLVGLSDHTLNNITATAATALGACIIEKHFTLSRAEGGVDSAFSLEPDELKQLVEHTKIAWSAVGSPCYRPTKSEAGVLKHRRSLYVVKSIKKGEKFTSDNIRSIRPANGLPPKYLNEIIGKASAYDIDFGTPLTFDHIKK